MLAIHQAMKGNQRPPASCHSQKQLGWLWAAGLRSHHLASASRQCALCPSLLHPVLYLTQVLYSDLHIDSLIRFHPSCDASWVGSPDHNLRFQFTVLWKKIFLSLCLSWRWPSMFVKSLVAMSPLSAAAPCKPGSILWIWESEKLYWTSPGSRSQAVSPSATKDRRTFIGILWGNTSWWHVNNCAVYKAHITSVRGDLKIGRIELLKSRTGVQQSWVLLWQQG